MRILGRLSLAALLLLSAAAPALAADETYAIKLSRPDKVGDQYMIDASVDSTRTRTIVIEGRDPQVSTENVKGQVQARVEYLEVDKKGDPTSLVMTVKKMVDGDGKELLKPGEEVKIKRDVKTATYTLASGEAVPAGAEQLLALLYGPHASDTPSDDETFGSADKHKVGDSWPINPELTAKGLATTGLEIDAKQLTGTTTLKSAENLDGLPVLRIACQIIAKDATPTTPDPTMKVESLNLQLDFSGAFPVDPSLSAREAGEKMSMEVRMTGTPQGAPAPVSATVKGQMTKTITYTPVKK